MFYLCNVSDWFSQIIREMQENRLAVEDSRFVLTLFSSMDFEMVDFFRDRAPQVSAYSGENLHIFTPILYDGGTIPDHEWDDLRKQFDNLGIPVGSRATAVVFSVVRNDARYEPQFIGAYHFPDGTEPRGFVKGLIDSCKLTTSNDDLSRQLETVFRTPNLIRGRQIDWQKTNVIREVADRLSMPTLFISHSSLDKPFVRRLADALISHKLRVWVDENEIKAGDNIRRVIDAAMQGSDYFGFVVSENSVKSDWVRYEVHNALSRIDETKILPLVIDNCMNSIPDTMKELKQLKYLDFTSEDNWSNAIAELTKSVRGW